MSVTLTGLDEWEAKIKRSVDSGWVLEQRLTFKMSDAAFEKTFKALPEKIEGWLKDFINKYFLSPADGKLYKEFEARNKPEYWPIYVSSAGEETRMSRKSKVNMGMGFDALWSRIAKDPVVRREGNRVVAGIGNRREVEGMYLNEYMGNTGSLRTSSKFNSLFLAAEFGTGVEKNVGAGNVRTTGDTKDPETPGAWWFGRPSDEHDSSHGVLFLGQKAMHFLYDERGQAPKAEYRDFFHRRFPQFVNAKLRGREG